MNEQQMRDFSRGWYYWGTKGIPQFGTIEFGHFAGLGNAFVYEVAKNLNRGISIRVTDDTDTGYVDLAKGIIYISKKYFTNDFYTKFVGDDDIMNIEELAIGLINGTIVHEALHVEHTGLVSEYSKGGIMDILKTVIASATLYEHSRRFGINILATMFNVVEDLYIESLVSKKSEKWLQFTSDILLKYEFINNTPNVSEIGDFINLLISYKNKENRHHPSFGLLNSRTKRILSTITLSGKMSLRRRYNLTVQLLKTFDGEISTEEKTKDIGDSIGGSSEDGEGDEDKSVEVGIGSSKVTSEIKSKIGKITSDDSDEEDKMIAEFESSSDDIATERTSEHTFVCEGGSLLLKDVTEFDVIDGFPSDAYFDTKIENSIDFAFLREIVAIRTAHNTIGQPRRSGGSIVKHRLTRIATDGKIFAKRDSQRKQEKRIEIVICIDFSGSTAGPVINKEIGAAKAISKVLQSANISHSVYGHTSFGDGEDPMLLHIFSHDMKVSNVGFEDRFEMSTKSKLCENYDGVIIKRLREKFTDRKSSRYIIMLSDGLPCGPGYYGALAIEHVKSELSVCRKEQINVFSISVVAGVVRNNDKIYGKTFNIDGSTNTVGQFRRLIKELVG